MVCSLDANSIMSFKPLSFESMVERADAIALVKIIEVKRIVGKYPDQAYRKEIIIEVLDPIYNMKKGNVVILIGYYGLRGSELKFDAVGAEAIVLMTRAKNANESNKIYHSAGLNDAVYNKLLDNSIERLGFWGRSVSYKKAKSKIMNELAKKRN